MDPEEKGYTLFYKYQPVNEHLIKNLEQNQLYFNDPYNYNDPFDSKIYGYSKLTEKQLIQIYMKAHPGISRDRAINALELGIKEKRLLRKGRLILADLSYIGASSPLTCCFSKERDNILLWSHYADHHKGVCLSFKAERRMKTEESRHTAKYGLTVNSVTTSLFNMNYENEKPKRIDLQETALTNDIEPFFDYLLTKSPCWTYENEYRLISDDNTNIKKFKKDELEGVIFGLRIKHHDACRIYKIIEENYINKGIYIKCYKVVECENEYAVEIEEVKNIHEYLENLSLKIW